MNTTFDTKLRIDTMPEVGGYFRNGWQGAHAKYDRQNVASIKDPSKLLTQLTGSRVRVFLSGRKLTALVKLNFMSVT